MRQIDLDTWPRREHFKAFSTFDYPHFSLCANVDLTKFYSYVKQQEISLGIIYESYASAALAPGGFCAAVCMGEVVRGRELFEDAFECARTSCRDGWFACW